MERSTSRTPGWLEALPVLCCVFVSAADELAMSGDIEADVEGGAGNVALAMREIGERFCAGDALALVRDESGLWEEGESSLIYACGSELVCRGDGDIWREPAALEREAIFDRALGLWRPPLEEGSDEYPVGRFSSESRH